MEENPKMMWGYFFNSDLKFPQKTKIPMPLPLENEALIKVLLTGICNTDLEIVKGYVKPYNYVLGHEFIGQVTDLHKDISNEKAKELIGKRVVGEINLPCKNCVFCKEEKKPDLGRNHCPNRKCLGIHNKDGVFAEYITLPIDNLLIVPENIPNEIAVFCEPLAAACRIIEQGLIKENDEVAVIGDGKLGLLIVEVIYNFLKKKITLFGRHENKTKLVQQKANINNNPKDFSKSFDVVIECSGKNDGLVLASSIAKPLGTVVLKSTCAALEKYDMSFMNLFVINELKLVGSRCGPFAMALKMLENKEVDLLKFIDKRFEFNEIEKAFEYSKTPGKLKVQITINN